MYRFFIHFFCRYVRYKVSRYYVWFNIFARCWRGNRLVKWFCYFYLCNSTIEHIGAAVDHLPSTTKQVQITFIRIASKHPENHFDILVGMP